LFLHPLLLLLLPLLLLSCSIRSSTCSCAPKARPMAALLLLLPLHPLLHPLLLLLLLLLLLSCSFSNQWPMAALLLLLLASLPSIRCTRCYYCCCCYCCCCYCCCPLPPPLALVPTKGQPLKGRVPPGLGLSPLWTPNAAAHMENDDDE